MDLATLSGLLKSLDQQGRWLVTANQLRRLSGDSPKAFEAAVRRHSDRGFLQRVVHGVYANPNARSAPANRLEAIARHLRPMDHSYISLESRLSELGLISQIPGILTVMTSGRSQRYETPYGTIEFTHTQRDIPALIAAGEVALDSERGVHVASAACARRDLKRVGRNLDLLTGTDEDEEPDGAST